MPSNAPDPPSAPDGTRTGRILITAGPTHEPIDEVRYLANRSSGRLGIALAEALSDLGAPVTLLLGPVPGEASHTSVETHRFRSASELESLLEHHFPGCDALIMAAAVADYRPKQAQTGQRTEKIVRDESGITLELESTPDLVAACAARRTRDQVIVAFALEPADRLLESGRAKLERKGVDAIVANPLETMDSTTISARFLTRDADFDLDPEMEKPEFARWLAKTVNHRLKTGSWSRKPHAD